MTQNFRSFIQIGIAVVILAAAASAYAQDSPGSEDWLSADQEPQYSHAPSLESSSPPSPSSDDAPSPDSSDMSSPDSSDVSLPDSFDTSSDASAPDSFDMPPSDFSDTPSLDASAQSSPDLSMPLPADSRSSAAETIHISAREYHPMTKQTEYQAPLSPAADSPLAATPASQETEAAEEDPALKAQPVKNSLAKPKNPSPADGAKAQPLNPMLDWSGEDSGEVTYTVYMGTGPDSMSREYNVIKSSLILPASLDQATTYYWKVEASDGDESSTSDIWSFATQDRPNRPPDKPQDPRPMDGAKNIPINTALSWSGEDPDGDAVEYTVYLSTNSSLEPSEYRARGRSLSFPSNLSSDVTYYWKVEASDGSLDNASDTWSFTTQGEPNNPPDKPRDPKPENHAQNQPANPMLSWDSEDPDGDIVTFTVYMGSTLNQMSEIYSGPEKNCSAPTSSYGATNFWRVEASDGKLINSSDVWSFTTRGQPVWEQPTTVNALIAALIAVVGGLAANYVKGKKS